MTSKILRHCCELYFLFFYICPLWAKAMSPIELLQHVDQIHRAEASYAELVMEIETPDWQRTLKLKAWSLGKDYTLIRILAPRKDKGVATLRRGREMWNFFPKINKVIKVPPSMMGGSWMGSDFSNDDLVKQTSLAKEYQITQESSEKMHTLILVPRKDTVTVWGKIVMRIDRSKLLPMAQEFYDEKGVKVRQLNFKDVKDFDGRLIPGTMEMIPLNKQKHKTTVRYEKLDLSLKLDKKFFSLRTLKRGK